MPLEWKTPKEYRPGLSEICVRGISMSRKRKVSPSVNQKVVEKLINGKTDISELTGSIGICQRSISEWQMLDLSGRACTLTVRAQKRGILN